MANILNNNAVLSYRDISAERALLSGLIGRMINIRDIELSTHDFYDALNRTIYGAIAELEADGEPVDVIIVRNKIKGNPTFNDEAYADVIASDGFNYKEYERIIRENAWKRRELILFEDVKNGKISVRDALSNMKRQHKSFKKMDILAVVNGPERIIDFVLPGLPRKSVGLLISPGGTGKSMLALSVGGIISSGHDDIGFSTISPVKTGKVSLFLGEDPDEIDELRMQEFWTTIPPEKRQLIAENMQIFPCLGDTGDLLDGGTTGDRIISVAGNSRLIIIDTLSRFHLGEENERKDAARVMRELERIALTTSAAVLILHHISKAAVLTGQGDKAEAARGSNVFVNESRWVAFLKGMGIKEASDFGIDKNFHSDYVRLGCSKLNYSKFFVDIWLKRGNGGILAAADDLNNKNKDENDKEKNYKKEYEDIPENWA